MTGDIQSELERCYGQLGAVTFAVSQWRNVGAEAAVRQIAEIVGYWLASESEDSPLGLRRRTLEERVDRLVCDLALLRVQVNGLLPEPRDSGK